MSARAPYKSAGGLWAARAEAYSATTARATLQAAPALLAAARFRPFTRVIDIACGPGYLAGAAAALGARAALGVDISGEMVAVARARQPAAEFEIGDAEALPEPDAAFDIALCNFGVFHLSNPSRGFAEAARVLAPGGTYAFSQWLGPEESPFFAGVLAAAADVGLGGGEASDDAFRLSDPERAAAALTRAGFVEVTTRIEPVVYPAPTHDLLSVVREMALPLALALKAEGADAAQDAEIDAEFRAALARRMAEFATADGYSAPMPALIVAGRKPSA